MSNMKGFAKKVHLLLVDHSMSQKKTSAVHCDEIYHVW